MKGFQLARQSRQAESRLDVTREANRPLDHYRREMSISGSSALPVTLRDR